MRYQKYFSIALNHAFLGNAKEGTIEIVPEPASVRLMKNLKLLCKSGVQEITVLQALQDDGVTPLVPIDAATHFEFAIRFQHPDFVSVTDWPAVSLDQSLQGTAFPLFHNDSLLASETALVVMTDTPSASEMLQVNQPGATENFYLKGLAQRSLTPADFSISGLGAVTNPSAYAEAEKRISIDTSAASAGDRFELSYPTVQKVPGLQARLRIAANASLVNSPTFSIQLDATSILWNVYAILPAGETQVSITDDDSGRAGGQLTFAATTLLASGNADPADDSIAAQMPDKSLVRLTASRALPYRREAYRQFRLSFLPTGETTPIEIAHIPNPGPASQGKIFIYL